MINFITNFSSNFISVIPHFKPTNFKLQRETQSDTLIFIGLINAQLLHQACGNLTGFLTSPIYLPTITCFLIFEYFFLLPALSIISEYKNMKQVFQHSYRVERSWLQIEISITLQTLQLPAYPNQETRQIASEPNFEYQITVSLTFEI